MSTVLHRKDSIILTAIDIIGDLGIKGLSTREIARRENISEGTIFKHFKSKNEIMLDLLDYFSKYDQGIKETIQDRDYSVKDAIYYFVNTYVEYYENYPAIVAITLNYNSLAIDQIFTQKIKQIYENRSNLLKEIINKGKKKGLVRKEIASQELVDIILGTVREICLRWDLECHSYSLRKKVLAALGILLDSNIFITK